MNSNFMDKLKWATLQFTSYMYYVTCTHGHITFAFICNTAASLPEYMSKQIDIHNNCANP